MKKKKNDEKNRKCCEKSLRRQLKDMHMKMRCRKLFLFWGRNRNIHKTYYYSKFIQIIGLETWEQLDPYYKNEWNSAKNSFDRMCGLIAAWCELDAFPLKKSESDEDKLKKAKSLLTDELGGLETELSSFEQALGKLEAFKTADVIKNSKIAAPKKLYESYGLPDDIKELTNYANRISKCSHNVSILRTVLEISNKLNEKSNGNKGGEDKECLRLKILK